MKQIDVCSMGGLISVVVSDIHVPKMEEDIVAPIEPHFYKIYLDDTYIQMKKNGPDSFFEKLNSYHPNKKLTIKKSPTKSFYVGVKSKQKFSIKRKSFQCLGLQKFLPDINVMP